VAAGDITRTLGLDAGGTGTRWAVAGADGRVQQEGELAALHGSQLASDEGRAALITTLQQLAQAAGPIDAVAAGVTGLDPSHVAPLRGALAQQLGVPAEAVRLMSDIELTCHAAFAPGEGFVVYAGTGSIAAFIDAQGTLHRAGGRGAVIDDAGGGHWIAREALRSVWRAEDREPGAWQASALARALFDTIGGNDWAATRQWVYGATRGELGTLALAVAAAAREGDVAAHSLLVRAGRELARLAQALAERLGPRPVALAGRVFELDPAIETALREALPAGTPVHRQAQAAHHAAARLACERTTP
jgi:N-acetylglucosamine kinase-like BadF-type ATPase